MRTTLSTSSHTRAAFTLVEMLFVLFVIAVLIGLLLVAFGGAIRGARSTASRQSVLAMGSAVEQFKNDFNILPPLVKDGFPTGLQDEPPGGPLRDRDGRLVPEVFRFADADDREYLKGLSGNPEYRFSIYSLSYYLVGALGKEIDGVEGPGALRVKRDGMFNRLENERYPSLYDSRGAGGLTTVDAQAGRIELQDANGVAFRYYRWQALDRNDPGYDSDEPHDNLGLPGILGDPHDNPSLGNAKYAIVAAGADGLFGTLGIESYPGQPAQDQEDRYAVEVATGERYDDDASAAAAAREDNIVEVGTDD